MQPLKSVTNTVILLPAATIDAQNNNLSLHHATEK